MKICYFRLCLFGGATAIKILSILKYLKSFQWGVIIFPKCLKLKNVWNKLGLNWAEFSSNWDWTLLQLNSNKLINKSSYWLNWLQTSTQNYQLPSTTHNLQSTQADTSHPKTSPASVYYLKLSYKSSNCHYQANSIHFQLAHCFSGWVLVGVVIIQNKA